jgi:hypothetical protein
MLKDVGASGFHPMRDRTRKEFFQRNSVATDQQGTLWLEGLHKCRRARVRLRRATAFDLDGGEPALA